MARILTIIFVFIISACSLTSSLIIKGKGNIKLEQVDYEEVPGWQKDEHDKALLSFLNSCEKFASMGNSRLIGGQIGDIKVADFRDVCDIGSAIKGMSSKQAKNFFENWFIPFKVSSKGGNSSGLFTGYYEPEIRGSRVKTDVYKYPVYSRPKDLGSGPYYSRKEIEEGVLADKKLELLYVEDKVDLFFLQVQGSGRVILPDGATVKITYDGKNNQPYTSIGNYIIENNVMKGAGTSYDAIKLWLKNNPEKANEVMNVNASYVFFKITGKEYVVGAQGTPLIAERSLAIDNDIMPYGFPIWVNTKIKNKENVYNPYQKLLVTQDAGSAIKGVVRGDIFFGRGANSERMAASMNSLGNYYIFLPVNVVDKFSGR